MATPIALTTMMDKDDDTAALQSNSSSKLETVFASSVDTIAANNLADTNGTGHSSSSSPLRPEIQILKDEHSALLRENEMLKEIWERIIKQQSEEKACTSTTTTPKCNNYNNNVVSSDTANNNNKGDDANIEDEMKNLHLEQQQQQQQQQYSEAPQMTPLSDYDEDTSNEQGVPNTIDISDASRESYCYTDEPSDFDRSNTNITDHQQSDQQQHQNQQQLEKKKKKFNYRRRSDEEEPIDYFEIYS